MSEDPKSADPARRNITYRLDALRYSCHMGELLESEIKKDLREIELCTERSNESLVIRLFMHVWVVVDIAHRVRELVQSIRGLRKNNVDIQVFLRYTDCVEHLRHYVQHLRTSMETLPDLSTPVWGSLSWAPETNKKACITVFSGSLHEGAQLTSLKYDVLNARFVSELDLAVCDIHLDIYKTIDYLKKLNVFLACWAAKEGLSYKIASVPLIRATFP